MKNLLILLILIGFSATAFAQYMRNISNQTLEYNLPIIRLTQENTIPPPLKQIKAGIAPKDVVCKQGLELVMKKSNGQPICVKGTSVKTLTLRNYIQEYNGALGGEVPTELSIDNTEVGSKENITKESKFPLWYRLSEAQRIVTKSFGKLPITGVGIDIHGELEISIHEDELKKIPNAKEYYEKLFKDMMPFEVPFRIEFGHVIPVDGLKDESGSEKNTFVTDKDGKVKLEGYDALDICGAVRLPCPTNPIFSGKMIDENNVLVTISGTSNFDVKLNQTHVCVTSETETTCQIRK